MTGISPWLVVPDAGQAADFYRRAFGAQPAEPSSAGDAPPVQRLKVGGGDFWVQSGQAGDEPDEPAFRLIIEVDDPDGWYARALAAGAEQIHGMHTEFGWRTGRLRDPFGHQWETARRLSE